MASKVKFYLANLIFSIQFLFGLVSPLVSTAVIPVTGYTVTMAEEDKIITSVATSDFIALNDFVAQVQDGSASSIKGVYVSDVMALRVVQQPADNAGYVSTMDGVVTQFGMAARYNTLGFLAHNYLAGELFFQMEVGDRVNVVYGDGRVAVYEITSISSYQALQPRSVSSNFVDLATGETLQATDVFAKFYTGTDHVTFQTCIQQGTEDSWGRLFVVAEPVSNGK